MEGRSLVPGNEEFENLQKQHQSLESRLEAIKKKGYLDPKDEVEARDIKKQKLILKDRMAQMVKRLSQPN